MKKKQWIRKKGRIRNYIPVSMGIIILLLVGVSFKVSALYRSELLMRQSRIDGMITASDRIVKLTTENNNLKYDNGILDFKCKVWRYKNPQRDFIIETVYRKSRELNADPFLILSVIQKESNFYVRARSKVAVGLMQINYSVWKEEYNLKTESDLYNVERNIEIGIRILRKYLSETGGDVGEALTLYNCGYKLHNPEYSPDTLNKYRDIRGE